MNNDVNGDDDPLGAELESNRRVWSDVYYTISVDDRNVHRRTNDSHAAQLPAPPSGDDATVQLRRSTRVATRIRDLHRAPFLRTVQALYDRPDNPVPSICDTARNPTYSQGRYSDAGNTSSSYHLMYRHSPGILVNKFLTTRGAVHIHDVAFSPPQRPLSIIEERVI